MTHLARSLPDCPAPFAAVIFDLDGTLIDTETTYRAAFMQAADAVGAVVPDGVYEALVGVASPERRAVLRARLGPGFPADAFFTAYYARRAALLPARIPTRPGAERLLGALRLPTAVATSASRPTAETHLLRSGLARYFDHVVTRDDVIRGKPAPDAYVRAAERLGVPPDRCLAVEDSRNGAESAHAAGMAVVMVTDPLSTGARRRCLAVVPNLHDLLAIVGGGTHEQGASRRPEPRRPLFVGETVTAAEAGA